jgi:hypothetical protein
MISKIRYIILTIVFLLTLCIHAYGQKNTIGGKAWRIEPVKNRYWSLFLGSSYIDLQYSNNQWNQAFTIVNGPILLSRLVYFQPIIYDIDTRLFVFGNIQINMANNVSWGIGIQYRFDETRFSNNIICTFDLR